MTRPADFSETAAELNRLERLAPYPSSENLRKTKAHAEDYAAALARLKEELKDASPADRADRAERISIAVCDWR